MSTTLSISPTRVVFAGGKFDSDRRYIRGAASGAVFPMPQGETIDLARVSTFPEWRYAVSNYAIQSAAPIDSGFQAQVANVKI